MSKKKGMPKQPKPDVLVVNHGSLFGMTPVSDAAREWMGEHIPEDAQWFGRQLMVEPRYVDPIIDGMQGDGLVVA